MAHSPELVDSNTDAAVQVASTVLDSLDVGILAVDADKHITFINRMGEGVLKINRVDVLGLALEEVLRTPRNSRWLVYDPDRVSSEQLQRVWRVKDRHRIVLRSRTLPVRDAAGEVVGSAAVFSEASDDSDEELHADRDRLMSLGELSASVAHEIRNPLTGIRTTVQFVQSKLGAKDSAREELDDVLKELDRIDQIITELLLFARPQPVRSVPIEINMLVGKTIDAFGARLDSGEVLVKRALTEPLPPVVGDSDMLGQVVFNLVSNAIESMPRGGELRVATSVRRSPSGKRRVNIFISDRGPGVSEEIADKIFNPFFTTRSMGTGLGLSVSLQIVRAHGGNLTFRNRRAGGATFRMSLPVDQPEEASS
ncbi:MAG: ATP-binding protein [Candidatus Eiseniibacteriota bacterium]|jgi:signal transduction histidine kinase